MPRRQLRLRFIFAALYGRCRRYRTGRLAYFRNKARYLAAAIARGISYSSTLRLFYFTRHVAFNFKADGFAADEKCRLDVGPSSWQNINMLFGMPRTPTRAAHDMLMINVILGRCRLRSLRLFSCHIYKASTTHIMTRRPHNSIILHYRQRAE